MNIRIPALALALIGLPLAAAAQSMPPPGHPAMTQAQRQAFHQTMRTFLTQEKQLHARMREQVLASISPIHRTAIANIIGGLAIAPKPDRHAAAAQIDRLLSGGERNAVLNARNGFLTQSKILHDAMRAKMASLMPAPAAPAQPHRATTRRPGRYANDPGSIVLRTLGGGHSMMTFMRRGGSARAQ